MKRVAYDILLFFFIFLLPWWVTLIWAVLGLFIFKNFYEFLISSVAVYVMYYIHNSDFLSFSTVVYALIIIFYLIVQSLRRRMILYKNEIPYKS